MRKKEKIKIVENLKEEMKIFSSFGIIDLYKFPANALQNIRRGLDEIAKIKVIKKSLLIRAINELGLKELEKIVPDQPAIILSNEEPFKLYLKIKSLKFDTFAKENDIASEDILVKAGPTDLNPGPVISEFAKVKIPAGVEGGKIAIKKDTIVARKNDKISKDLASILRKLKIKPIKISAEILWIYYKNKIYTKDLFKLVEDMPNLLVKARNNAINLSVFISYPTKENISILLSKAYNHAKILKNIIGGVN